MSGKYLLDTNIVIALFAEDPAVQKHMARAGEIFIPVIVIGELYFGAFKSGRPRANTLHIEKFAAGPVDAMRFIAMPKMKRMESVKRHRKWQEQLKKEIFFKDVFNG